MKNLTKKRIANTVALTGVGIVSTSAAILANRIIADVTTNVKMPKIFKTLGYFALTSGTMFTIFNVGEKVMDEVVDIIDDIVPDDDDEDDEDFDSSDEGDADEPIGEILDPEADRNLDIDNAPMMKDFKEVFDDKVEAARINDVWGNVLRGAKKSMAGEATE